MTRHLRGLGLAALLGLTAGTIVSVVSAQIPTRMHATQAADIPTGTPTPVTCTASGAGCFLDVVINGALANLSTFAFGTGTATASLQGTLTTNTTAVCTIANTSETDLWTYSLPANALTANGRGVRITVHATTAATANNKAFSLYFGATVVATYFAAANNKLITLTATVLRTGASAELSSGLSMDTAGNTATAATPAADTTGAITIKLTGTNGTAAANDACSRDAVVETLK